MAAGNVVWHVLQAGVSRCAAKHGPPLSTVSLRLRRQQQNIQLTDGRTDGPRSDAVR